MTKQQIFDFFLKKNANQNQYRIRSFIDEIDEQIMLSVITYLRYLLRHPFHQIRSFFRNNNNDDD
ncbi:hypothetical protein DERP_003566 [Dermatophagoides pteronyssinus]|uniref:Uncharacterized protein n=1 Tax=Dermatophagoides pteronyssinus TaxID=6956 RepID=A0ABQ8JLJ1_DERPT|nr:hypothetical protein DERP_003566 [Dermatophagoides pteronyssinus]